MNPILVGREVANDLLGGYTEGLNLGLKKNNSVSPKLSPLKPSLKTVKTLNDKSDLEIIQEEQKVSEKIKTKSG